MWQPRRMDSSLRTHHIKQSSPSTKHNILWYIKLQAFRVTHSWKATCGCVGNGWLTWRMGAFVQDQQHLHGYTELLMSFPLIHLPVDGRGLLQILFLSSLPPLFCALFQSFPHHIQGLYESCTSHTILTSILCTFCSVDISNLFTCSASIGCNIWPTIVICN